ncbi:hypothetical protein GCM10009579_03220 [Streptomyces javensis]|uniref:Uncharacterized protein n=1 Tax=Streptomyces javensis TaxID=114698 RepID=A0ABP4H3H8_9ACTN
MTITEFLAGALEQGGAGRSGEEQRETETDQMEQTGRRNGPSPNRGAAPAGHGDNGRIIQATSG